jgi:hypothetical protein
MVGLGYFESMIEEGYDIGLVRCNRGRLVVCGERYRKTREGEAAKLWSDQNGYDKAKEAFDEYKRKRDLYKKRNPNLR